MNKEIKSKTVFSYIIYVDGEEFTTYNTDIYVPISIGDKMQVCDGDEAYDIKVESMTTSHLIDINEITANSFTMISIYGKDISDYDDEDI
jgi:hypothetical protein